jgi:hypothetical protein
MKMCEIRKRRKRISLKMSAVSPRERRHRHDMPSGGKMRRNRCGEEVLAVCMMIGPLNEGRANCAIQGK